MIFFHGASTIVVTNNPKGIGYEILLNIYAEKFYGILNDCKSSEISRTFQSILTHYNSDVVWMISILSLTFSSPISFKGLYGPFQSNKIK